MTNGKEKKGNEKKASERGSERSKSERIAKSPPPPDKKRGALRLRIALVVLAAFAVGLGVLLSGGDDDDGGDSGGEGPRIVSAAELLSLAASIPTPVYWAGEQAGTQIELTEEPNGNVTVRYLEGDAEPGSESAAFLTIGSYPQADPQAELDAVATNPGAIVRKAPDGRKVVTNEESPFSVYFADLDNTVQVEVYDPSGERAMELALSGQVQPAG
jgi:hypothetical protein